MNREELIRTWGMEAIANDYEDFEMVVAEVTRWAAAKGTSTNRSELAAGLADLLETGLAKAYELSGRLGDSPRELLETEWRAALIRAQEGEIPYYFYLTKEGKRILKES